VNSLLARVIGLQPGGAANLSPMPRALFLLLAATIFLFYANNAAVSAITPVLVTAKWVPMIGLCVIGVGMLRNRPIPSFPLATLLPLSVLFVVSLLGALLSEDSLRSVFALISVVVAAVFGYIASALIVATDSRRAFFDLVGNVGRVLVLSAAVFAAAGIDLGRGGGFGAWMDNPNTLALVMAPGMVVFMAGCIERRPGWLIWHAAFFLIGARIMWTTNARSAFVWLILSGFAFWIYRRGPAVTSIAALIVLAAVIGWWEPIRQYTIETLGLNWSARNVGISPLSGREEVWRIGWNLFQQKMLIGYGFGTTQTLVKAESWRFLLFQGGHFHSSYIETMVETGLFGLLSLLALLGITCGYGIKDAARTRQLPRQSWPLSALPFAMILGAMGHAIFESWLLAAGNANAPLFWTCLFLVYHQAHVPIRAIRSAPRTPALRSNGRGAQPAA
jgi:O-antigen ligase